MKPTAFSHLYLPDCLRKFQTPGWYPRSKRKILLSVYVGRPNAYVCSIRQIYPDRILRPILSSELILRCERSLSVNCINFLIRNMQTVLFAILLSFFCSQTKVDGMLFCQSVCPFFIPQEWLRFTDIISKPS